MLAHSLSFTAASFVHNSSRPLVLSAAESYAPAVSESSFPAIAQLPAAKGASQC